LNSSTNGISGEREFTTFETARLCGVFHTTVINWVNKGSLRAGTTPGGHRRIALSELAPFMRKHAMPLPADFEGPRNRVLILDDEPAVTRLLEKRFVARGDRYSVRVSNDPVDALLKIGREVPDLLVVDLGMPVMNGFQVCRELKSSPVTKDMKIVAISGRRLTGVQRAFLAENADVFLEKPFEMTGFFAHVDRLLAAQSAPLGSTTPH